MTEKPLEKIRFPALAAIIAAAFALRLDLAVKAFYSTFDTTTVGLMALRILREGERPLFYYGQDYMGALEAYTAVPFIALFGTSTTVLSLASIFYALGWVLATYLLFAEVFGIAGGLAAAVTVAACGWYPLWFSMATYGGYSIFFFCGTLFLWLMVRICFRPARAPALYALCSAAGVAAALGIWTNPQVFSYLAAGAFSAAMVLIFSRDQRRRLILPLSMAALVSLLGFLPSLYIHLGPSPGIDNFVDIRPVHIPTNIWMFLVSMKREFFWPETPSELLRTAAFFSWAGILVIGLGYLLRNVWSKKEIIVPLVFIPLFLGLFLLHPKASTGATRYTISFMTMGTALLAAAAVSCRNRVLRGIAFLFLAVWTAYNVTSSLATAEEKNDRAETIRDSRRKIISAAEDLGLRHVEIIGSQIDGLEGQCLTFFADDRVRFVAILDERHLPSSIDADRDNRAGLICYTRHFEKVRDAMASAGFSYSTRQASNRMILYNIEAPPDKYRSVPPREMEVKLEDNTFQGLAGRLIDRDDATGLEYPSAEEMPPFVVEVTFSQPMAIGAITLYSPLGKWAAGGFLVSGSLDGREFHPLAGDMSQLLPVGRAGNKALIMRHLNPVELHFPPQEVRFLRIRIQPVETDWKTWNLSEIFFFEHLGAGSSVPQAEVEAISAALQTKNIDFCAADPWLSPRLSEMRKDLTTYRRYNRRHRLTRLHRNLKLRPGLAFVVDESLAGEAAGILREGMYEGLTMQEEDFGHYRLFSFTGQDMPEGEGGPLLIWNDQMVLKTSVPESWGR